MSPTLSAGQAHLVAQGQAFTPAGFANDLLAGLGAPASPENLEFIQRWEKAEGGHWLNNAHYNPLDTSLRTYDRSVSPPRQTSVNYRTGQPTTGVQAYPDAATGLAATVSTLKESRYTDVVAALKRSDPVGAAIAVVKSPWDAGHYSFHPSHLWPAAPATTSPSDQPPSTSAPIDPAPVDNTGGAHASLISDGGLNLNPFDAFGLFSSAKSDIARIAVNVTFIAAGLGLVVLGVWKTADPGAGVTKAAGSAASVAKLAAL